MKQITISWGAAGIVLEIPSETSDQLRHISIPATEAGMKVLVRLLRERSSDHSPRAGYIGRSSSPTQEMVAKWLATERQELAALSQQRREKKLNEMELKVDLGDLLGSL